jgi:hypothetical protein
MGRCANSVIYDEAEHELEIGGSIEPIAEKYGVSLSMLKKGLKKRVYTQRYKSGKTQKCAKKWFLCRGNLFRAFATSQNAMARRHFGCEVCRLDGLCPGPEEVESHDNPAL